MYHNEAHLQHKRGVRQHHTPSIRSIEPMTREELKMKKITQEQFDKMFIVEDYSYHLLKGGLPKLEDCELNGLDFKGVNLKHCTFSRCNINNCNMRKVKMSGSWFVNCNINCTDMSGADFELTDFMGTTFNCVSLAGSNMMDTCLEDAVFKSVDFRGAKYKETSFIHATVENSNLTQAIVDENDPRLSSEVLTDAEIIYTIERVSKLIADKSALLREYLRSAEELEATLDETYNLIKENTVLVRESLESIGEYAD